MDNHTDANEGHSEITPSDMPVQATENSKLVAAPTGSGCLGKLREKRWMVLVRLFYLTFYATESSAEPYYSVYFKQKGFGPGEIGLFFGIRPILGFIASPLWGMLGDRFRIRRLLFFVLWICWVGTVVALGAFPYAKRSKSCPDYTQCNVTGVNTTGEDCLSEGELYDAKKDIHWVYDSSSLNRVIVAMGMIVLAGELFQAPVGAIVDVGVLQEVKVSPGHQQQRAINSYGSVRAVGSFGWGVASFATGALLSSSRYPETICGINLVFSNYMIFVYMYLALGVVCVIIATQIQFDEVTEKTKPTNHETDNNNETDQPRAKANAHDTLQVLKTFANIHYGSFLCTIFLCAICKGLMWAFLFWHLENLGGTQLLMGVQGIVETFSEVAMFVLCEHYFVKRFGHIPTFCVGAFFYSGAIILYGIITNPWLSIPIAVLHGSSFPWMWVPIVTYLTAAVPEASAGTALGIAHGIHYGLGLGTGKLVGGYMIDSLGAAVTFPIIGGFTWFVLVLFIIIQAFNSEPDSPVSPLH